MFSPCHRQSSVTPIPDRLSLYHCPEIQRNFCDKMKRPPIGGHYRKFPSWLSFDVWTLPGVLPGRRLLRLLDLHVKSEWRGLWREALPVVTCLVFQIPMNSIQPRTQRTSGAYERRHLKVARVDAQLLFLERKLNLRTQRIRHLCNHDIRRQIKLEQRWYQ